MSKYTMTLDFLKNNGFVFNLNDYPIFNESYRNTLNDKILNHYRFREIGVLEPDKFNHYLGVAMNEIMYKYNIMYAKLEGEVDLFIDNEETSNETSNTTGTNNTDTDNTVSTITDTELTSLTTDTGDATSGTVSDITNVTNLTSGTDNTVNNSGDTTTTVSGSDVVKKSDTPQGTFANTDFSSVSLTEYNENNKDDINATNEDTTVTNDTDTITDTTSTTGTVSDTIDATDSTSDVISDENVTSNVINNTGVVGGSTGSFILDKISKRSVKPLYGKLMEFEKTFKGVDSLIIEELNNQDLFMNIH